MGYDWYQLGLTSSKQSYYTITQRQWHNTRSSGWLAHIPSWQNCQNKQRVAKLYAHCDGTLDNVGDCHMDQAITYHQNETAL